MADPAAAGAAAGALVLEVAGRAICAAPRVDAGPPLLLEVVAPTVAPDDELATVAVVVAGAPELENEGAPELDVAGVPEDDAPDEAPVVMAEEPALGEPVEAAPEVEPCEPELAATAEEPALLGRPVPALLLEAPCDPDPQAAASTRQLNQAMRRMDPLQD